LLVVLFLALSACDAQHHGDEWKKRADGSAPGLADTQDCHAEAQRQAAARYPPQRIMNGRVEMTFENRDLFPAEISFFEECLRRKGFERTPQ
jgi:hypothetical protein